MTTFCIIGAEIRLIYPCRGLQIFSTHFNTSEIIALIFIKTLYYSQYGFSQECAKLRIGWKIISTFVSIKNIRRFIHFLAYVCSLCGKCKYCSISTREKLIDTNASAVIAVAKFHIYFSILWLILNWKLVYTFHCLETLSFCKTLRCGYAPCKARNDYINIINRCSFVRPVYR